MSQGHRPVARCFATIGVAATLSLLSAQPTRCAEPGPIPVIDVLVLYTPAAVEAVGPIFSAQLKQMENEANGVFLNSYAQVRVRVVHTAKVAYTEPPAAQLTLDRLTDPLDGYVDEVTPLRAQYGADIVVLMTTGDSGPNGFLAPLRPNAAHAFGVLTSTRDYAFTRLIGRLLGCEAQRGPVEQIGRVIGEGAFLDSHAFVVTNSGWGTYGTVMAERLTWLPLFSNPNLIYFGNLMGIPGEADNVRTINLTAPDVASFSGLNNWVTPPQIQWLTPAPGAIFTPGADIHLQVSATSSTGVVQRVEFYQVDVPWELTGRLLFTAFAPDPSGVFSATLTNAPAGWYRLLARAVDNQGEIGQAAVEFQVCGTNDNFSNRIQLASPSARLPINLSGMSLEPGEEALAAPGVAATAWYTWTAAGDGYLYAQARAVDAWIVSPVVRAYFGSQLTNLTPTGVNPESGAPLLLPVRRGDTVQLSVGCSRNGASPAMLALDFLPPITNDSFATRITATGSSVQIAGHNVGATTATNGIVMGTSVWWSWIPSLSGIAQIQASNFAPSQVISVFKGDQPGTLSLLTQINPYSPGSVGQGFPVQAGQPLQIAVTSPIGYPTGPFDFRLVILSNAANSTFATRFNRTANEWSELLIFPGVPEPGVPAGVGPYTAWWEWTASHDGSAMLSVSGWGAPKVSVFTGDSLATLQPAETLKAGWGLAAFPVTAGTKYQIALSWPDIPYYLGAGFAPVLHFGYLPANDSFAQPILLSGTAVDWTLSNALGTAEPNEPTAALASWWYSWTAPARGRVDFSVTGLVSVTVFRGSALGQLTNVLSQDYWDPLAHFLAEPGVEYRIAVESGGLDSLPVSAHIYLQFRSPPANDQFAARQLLTGSQYQLTPDLGLATSDLTDPVIPNADNHPRTLWWTWVVPTDGIARFSTLSSTLGIYQGTSLGSLRRLAYGSGWPGALLGVNAGQVLQLMLAGDGAYPASLGLELLPTWGNDSFAGRQAMELLPGNPLSLRVYGASTEGATRQSGETLSSTNAVGHTRWWTWQTPVPATAKVTVTPYSSSLAYAEQFSGVQLSSHRSLSWQEASFPILRFHVEPGIEYPLVVDAVGTNDFSYGISVDLIPDAPSPANDSFAQAQILQGPVVTLRGTHRTATAELGEPAHAGVTPARSLWWQWTAPATGRVRLYAKPISSDAATPVESYPVGTLAFPHRPSLAIYLGDTLPSLQEQPSQEVTTTNLFAETLEFDAIANQAYTFALDGGDPADADVGEFELQLIQLPTNDNFADRILLQGQVAVLSGTVFGATRPENEWVAQWPSSSPSPGLMNTWWEWTAPADLRVTLRNSHPYEHFWAVWRSTDVLQWAPHRSVMDRYFGWEDTRRDFVVHAGETWEIAVYADPNNTTPVEIELEAVPVPPNDDFAGRIPLNEERVCLSARADNTSRELNEPPHGIGTVPLMYGQVTNAPSLWWSWTAPRSGRFALTTAAQAVLQSQLGSPWDQIVRADCFVYQGDQLTGLSLIAGTAPDKTSPPSDIKRVTFAATASTTYQIALCPIFMEKRIWDTAKYFVNLAIDPITENSSPETALELVGSSPSFSGNLRGAVDDLWWRWTAPGTGTYRFAERLGGPDLNRHLLFQVYRRDQLTGDLVACDPGLPAQVGETYWIKVSVQPLNWWEEPPTVDGRDLPFDAALGLSRQATNNDNFAQRERLTGSVAVLVGDDTAATREPGEPLHAGVLGRGSLWWQWTAPHTGRWTLAPRIAPWRPLLLDIYQGDSLATLERIPSQSNPADGRLIFQAQAGRTYAIAIDNSGYYTGPFEVYLFEPLPPTNDAFANRIQLDGLSPIWDGQNVGGSADADEPDHSGCLAAASVWWSWTAPTSCQILLSVSGAGATSWAPPRLEVYRGDSLQALTSVAANRVGGELRNNLTFHAEPGVTYAFALDTSPAETGTFQLALTPTNAPANDDFARRIALVGSQAYTETFNYGATFEPGEPNPLESPVDATLWWTWTASGSGLTIIDTVGSSFDTRLAVYQGSSLASLVLIGINDDAASLPGGPVSYDSRLTFNAQAGITYQIQVGSVTGNRGLVELTLIGPDTPPAQLFSAEISNGAGTCLLHLRGTPGQTVLVQASNDLLNWQNVGSVRFISADAVWSEPFNPAATTRFFQLINQQ